MILLGVGWLISYIITHHFDAALDNITQELKEIKNSINSLEKNGLLAADHIVQLFTKLEQHEKRLQNLEVQVSRITKDNGPKS